MKLSIISVVCGVSGDSGESTWPDLNNDKVEKVNNWEVLGMIFQENLFGEKHIDQLICTCNKKLFVLKKINRFASHHKNLENITRMHYKNVENILVKL